MSHGEPLASRVQRVATAVPPVSWPRVALTTIGTLFVLILVFFYVPHWLLTHLGSVSRGARVWLATAWMALVFAMSCVAALRSTRTVTQSG
jgi:hypothetical protein